MLPTTGTCYDAQRKIWSGPRIKDLYNIEMTVGEAVLRELLRNPHKVIQITDSIGEQIKAQEFMDYSKILAQNLIRMDMEPKDVMGLYAQNSTHVATVMMAAFLIGAPVHALYPEFDKENIKLLFKDTRPRIIFCDVENHTNAVEALTEMKLNAKIVVMNGNAEGHLNIKDLLVAHDKESLNSLVFPCVHMTGADTAVILCSSGTTGTPKAVMCSHHALLNKNIYFTVRSNSVVLCFSTMYWASGLLNLVSSLLNSTVRIVTEQAFTPEYLLHLVERYKITHLFISSNQAAELILKLDGEEIRKSLSSVDTLLCGGAKVPLMVQETLLNILSDNVNRPGLSIIYGMTEVSGGITLNSGYPFEFLKGTEGKLLPNKQVRIVDKSGQNLGPNESGEILVYSPYNWLGYYRDAVATAKAFTFEWLHSGDIGCIDDKGFLRVNGRDKDMFKYKGFQICPQLIEDAILHISGVAEVCVFPRPDSIMGNVVACAIVQRNDAGGESLSKEMVLDYVSHNLDSLYHLRGGVSFVDHLPKTSSGKVQRQKVVELILERESKQN